MEMMPQQEFVGLGVLLVIWGIIMVLSVVGYVFQSIAFMKMAEREEIPNPWLAWIPIANYWIIGELLNAKLNGDGGKKLLIGVGGMVLFSWVPVIGFLLTMAWCVFAIVIWHWLFEKYSRNPMLDTIITIIFFPYGIYRMFVLRNEPANF